MKRITLALFAAGLLLTIAACNNQQTASEASKTSSADSLNKAKKEVSLPDSVIQKNWIAYGTPGEVHKMMASWDGTWEGQVSQWMQPGAEPSKSTSTTVNKTVMDGRYQISTHKGTMGGAPFEGIGTLAYDNAKKVFIQSWVDNMGTGIMTVEGPWDAASKSVTMTGNMVDPSAGTAKEMQVKEVFKIIDDNNHIFEMYVPGSDGKEFKTMEIIYSRKM